MNSKFYSKKFILMIFFLLCTPILFAQTTRVSGVVTDASNKQPVPFATVSFLGTSIGMPTDNNGKYKINTTNTANNKIRVSIIGYHDITLPVIPGKDQVVNVKLVPETQELEEVSIKAGPKPKYR